MGNLNRRRAIGAARAAVRDDGGCLSRAARKRFTADGLLAGTNERPLCLPMRISPDPCLCKHVAYWQIVLQKSFSTRDQKFSGL